MVDDAAGQGLRVVLAPDKFKGTLTAPQAAHAMAAAVREVLPGATTVSVPMADGGEGTVEALVGAGATEHRSTVTGALGQPVVARFAEWRGVAYVEAAEACGLQLIEPSPQTALAAHSHGVGELLGAALDLGVDSVVLALGGVSTTDGGTGMLAALGARLLDSQGVAVPPGGAGLEHVARIDLGGLDPRLRHATVVIATDVTNPLTGPEGAAAVYGPQKGAGAAEIVRLDEGLAGFARCLASETGQDVAAVPGAGAAGGLGAALLALGARVVSGFELLLDAVDLPAHLDGAALVVTGEGRLDAQSLFGKVPVGVARRARDFSVPVIVVAGAIEIADTEVSDAGFEAAWSLVETIGLGGALDAPSESLRTVTAEAVRRWAQLRTSTSKAAGDAGRR